VRVEAAVLDLRFLVAARAREEEDLLVAKATVLECLERLAVVNFKVWVAERIMFITTKEDVRGNVHISFYLRWLKCMLSLELCSYTILFVKKYVERDRRTS